MVILALSGLAILLFTRKCENLKVFLGSDEQIPTHGESAMNSTTRGEHQHLQQSAKFWPWAIQDWMFVSN